MSDCCAFGAGHLDSWLSAYVDEELAAPDAERVESHLMECESCARSVADIEEMRHALAVPAISPSQQLIDRLRHIEHSEEPPAEWPQTQARTEITRKWRQRVAGSLVGVAAITVVLALVGSTTMPDVRGTAATIAQDHWMHQGAVDTASHAQFTERDLDVPVPDNSGIDVLDVAFDGDRQETEAVLQVGETRALMRQGRGKLLPDDHAPGQVQRIGGHEIHVVEGQPWTAIWQCGDTVVTVAADASPDVVETLVEALPPRPYDDGIPAHVARGMYTLRTAIGKKAP